MPTPVQAKQCNTAAPVDVTGSTNAEGASTALARADHQHRLEVEVEDGGTPVGARPTLNFIGATVADDGGNDRVNVTVSGGLVQTDSDRVTTQTDKSNATFSTLLSVAMTTGANRVQCFFSASFIEILSLTGARAEFRLVIDGVVQENVASNVNALNEPQSVSLVFQSAVLTAGSHTIEIEWRRLSLIGTVRIDPATNVGHADLLVNEVAV